MSDSRLQSNAEEEKKWRRQYHHGQSVPSIPANSFTVRRLQSTAQPQPDESPLTGPSIASLKGRKSRTSGDGEGIAESRLPVNLTIPAPVFEPIQTRLEETSSKRSQTASKRTSILSSLFFPSKSDRTVRDGNKMNQGYPATPTKSTRKQNPPPSPRSAFNLGFRNPRPNSIDEGLPETTRNSLVSVPASDEQSSRPSSGITQMGPKDSPLSTPRKLPSNENAPAKTPSILTQTSAVHDPMTEFRATIKERRSSRHAQGMQELVETPGGTVYGVGGTRPQSRPLALFRQLSKRGLNSIFNAAGQSDFIRADELSRDPSSGSSKMAPPTPSDTVYTQTSGYLSLAADSNTTGLSSAQPSSATNTATSFDLSPALVTPPYPMIASDGSDGMVTSASITSSSSPSRRPNLNRTRAFREDRRDELLQRLDQEDQRAIEALIDVEAIRKCRQALIDIEEDTVFAKAMAQVMKKQFPAPLMMENANFAPQSPHQSGSRPELQKDAIKASFLVREILGGERNYARHLENGIKLAREQNGPSSRAKTNVDKSSTSSGFALSHSLSDNMVDLSRRGQAPVGPAALASRINASQDSRRSSAFENGHNQSLTFTPVTTSGGVQYGWQQKKSKGNNTDILVQHFQRLIYVSGRFVRDMEYDPDPYGVAVWFSQNYRELKDAYADWASVAAEFVNVFAPVELKKGKLSHSLSMPGRRRLGGMATIANGKPNGPEATQASRLDLSDIVRDRTG